MILFITHINNLLLDYSNAISKYCCLSDNSTDSRIYSFIARKRTSSDQFNQFNQPNSTTTKSKYDTHHSGINESKSL